MNKKTTRKTGRRSLWIIALLVVLIGAAITGTGVAAKYLRFRKAPENLVLTHNFYFESDILKESKPEVNVNAGTSSVSFDLYNFADDLRFSELDIYYEVRVKAPDGTVSTMNTGTLAKDAQSTKTLTLTGLVNGKSYEVTATGKSGSDKGYSKTISAIFKVGTEETKVYEYLYDRGDYVDLAVWTEGEAQGALSIAYPAGLIPDNSDPAMSGWSTGAATGTGTLGAYASHTYRFFKTDASASFTAAQFTVSVGSVSATVKDPQS